MTLGSGSFSGASVFFIVITGITVACGGGGTPGDVSDAGRGDADAATMPPRRDGGTSATDTGEDAGCDPNIPLSATVVPINDPKNFKHLATEPTPCTEGLACTYQDLQINYTTCAGSVEGFRFRYVRPLDAHVTNPSLVPALISEPGSGSCWVGQSTYNTLDEVAAANGAIVLEVAPRGQFLCYLEGDALYQQSDWLGPETLADYDRLLLAFTRGWVDPKLHADPARLGIHGVSHGGLASFLYGRATHVPAVTGQPLALVIPELGNPDLASWSVDGFDPADLNLLATSTEMNSMPWGSIRIDGLVGWETEYAGIFAAPFAKSVLDQTGVPTWVPQFLARSAHDDAAEATVKTFAKNTKHFLGVTATEDCIIPHQGAFDFYQQVQSAMGSAHVRLLSSVAYHSCGDTPASLMTNTGYLPKVTGANLTHMGNWETAIESAWISRYLIGVPPTAPAGNFPPIPDPGEGDPTNQPEWMFMLADEGLGSATPTVYTSSPPGALETTALTYSLGNGTTSIGGANVAFDSATLSYDPGAGATLNLVSPTWNASAAAEIDIDFPVTEDFVVIGQPDLTLFVKETSTPAASYSFTVLLEDIRPGESAPWPVGSERRFSHTNTGTMTKQEILMDTVKSHFKAGDTLRVAITNIALMTPSFGTGTAPMFAPSLNRFTVAFQSTLGGQTSTLTLPTVPYPPTEVPSTWRIQN